MRRTPTARKRTRQEVNEEPKVTPFSNRPTHLWVNACHVEVGLRSGGESSAAVSGVAKGFFNRHRHAILASLGSLSCLVYGHMVFIRNFYIFLVQFVVFVRSRHSNECTSARRQLCLSRLSERCLVFSRTVIIHRAARGALLLWLTRLTSWI